jgi:hypothetical protein
MERLYCPLRPIGQMARAHAWRGVSGAAGDTREAEARFAKPAMTTRRGRGSIGFD